jgi:hypothetical protein
MKFPGTIRHGLDPGAIPARSLLHFVHTASKNRRPGDFYSANSESRPANRGFYDFFNEKSYKNLQMQQAASAGIF